VLRGIPVDDFMGTMGVVSAALGFDCSECHTGAGTDRIGLGRRHSEKNGRTSDGDHGSRHQ
jgi:hypothetical protein